MKMMLTMVEAVRPLVSARIARILVVTLVAVALLGLAVSSASACGSGNGC